MDIKIIQSLSQQVLPGHLSFIKGARPGQILIGYTEFIVVDALDFLVTRATRSYLQWEPMREFGGRLKEDHREDPAVLGHCLPQTRDQRLHGKYTNRNGNEVMEYTHYFGITEDSGRVDNIRLTATLSDILGVLQEGSRYHITTEKTSIKFGTETRSFYAFKAEQL